MPISEELEVDRLRVKFPRSYKALVQLYPGAWDQMLAVIERAMTDGKTASVVVGKLSILRGLDRSTRRWVMLSVQADRREVVLRQQRSFLTELHDKTLDDLIREINALEASVRGTVQTAPSHGLARDHVFISHHAKTSGKFGLRLATHVEERGTKCWIAPRDVPNGSIWNQEVYGAVQRCVAMILLACGGALTSPPVSGEVAIAVARRVPIFVVRLCEADPAQINIALAAYQYSGDWIGRSLVELPELAQRLHLQVQAIGNAEAA